MCSLTCPLLYLSSATEFDHRACYALFEGYGVSFPGVRMSAVVFDSIHHVRLRFRSGSVFGLRLNDMASVFFIRSVPYNDRTTETERKTFY